MHTSIHSEVTGIIRHSRTQWFTAYSALSPVIGFLATVAGGKLHRLDASTEASGPHGFAVRIGAVRQERRRVHRIQPRVRDDRDTPLGWGGRREFYTDLGIRKIRIFLQTGLDRFC